GDIGRLSFGGVGGGGGFGGFGGGAAGRPAGGPPAGAPPAGAPAGAPPAAAVAGGPGAAPAGGPPRGGFGGPAPAPQPPIVVSRLGKDYTVTQTNVRAGTEMRVTTEREEMNVTLREMDEGSWIMLELPGFAKAASGRQQNSLDALRVARETSWFKSNDALWIKMV